MPKTACWHQPLCLAPHHLHPWLSDPGSLTTRLKARFPQFRVQVLLQGWQPAHQDEYIPLQLTRQHLHVATREVLLLSGNTPLVFAHSITLRKTLRGGVQLLGRIGSRPLGESLFANPTIRRSPLSWRCVDARHPLWRKAQVAVGPLPRRLWARRSVFQTGNDRLLVTELFLPAIDASP